MQKGLDGSGGLAGREQMRLQAFQPEMVTYTAVVWACGIGWMAESAFFFCSYEVARTQPEMATPQWSALEESAKWQ